MTSTSSFSTSKPSKEKKRKSGGMATVIFAILFLLASGGFGYMYINYQKAQKQIVNLSKPEVQDRLAQEEINQLLEKVGKHIILPEGEGEPMVASITDAEKLVEEQPFYKGVQNGDKIIIYKTKALIYNPERDILVNVGPVFMEPEEEQKAQNESDMADNEAVIGTLTIEIRNGSNVVGVATELSTTLSANTQYEVIEVVDASNKNYTETMLINLTGENVNNLVQELEGATITDALPEGEMSSIADVIIILGS